MPQSLMSAKDQSNFRQVVKFYEAKQYKKAIKTADLLLKKNPNHGETEAMKALTLNAMGNSEEGLELGKVALKHDLKSYICWHVYGLLYRSAKQFDEAVKAYKFALKLEPESAQILRDLAFLQVHIRDYAGYIESRKLMLQAKPFLRQNWTALAVAYHLGGFLESAEDILKRFEETLKQPPLRSDSEHSELVYYRNSIIEETGQLERALEHLESIFKLNLDRTGIMEARARLLLKLKKNDDAEKAYRDLVQRNNEYRLYYESLEKAVGLDRSKAEDIPKLAELYETFVAENDRVDATRRIPLDFLQGEKFRDSADKYLRKMLRKGVPSTFVNIKGLYGDESKRSTIVELVNGYIAELQANNGSSVTNGERPGRFKESCLFFLAQHYNYHITRNLDKALKYVNEAIELDPKSVVYVLNKARIYKHLGDPEKAAEVMEQARLLDEKDRYINTKCAKYQLRNNENAKALQTMSKFTRNEAVGGPLGDLMDMQCTWFLTEDGNAYRRQGKLGLALRRYKAVFDVFEIWQEDQFDFHHYSMRKGAVRAYVDMIHWQDHLREHPSFSRAAISAVEIYVALHDRPHLAHAGGGLANGIPNFEGMDAAERKKAMKKAKRDQERRMKSDAAKAEKASPGGAPAGEKKKDVDADAQKLADTKTPLEDAMPYVNHLLDGSARNIKAQLVAFDVYLRRKKYLMAFKCLQAAHQLNPKHPGLHERIVYFVIALPTAEDPLHPVAASILSSNSSFIPPKAELEKFNELFRTANRANTAAHVFAALRARARLGDKSKSVNEGAVSSILPLSKTTIDDAHEGLGLLRGWGSDEAVVKLYLEKVERRWKGSARWVQGL